MTARCFKRLRDDDGRCGIWIMTRPTGRRGAFFHGDHDEIQGPRYTIEELSKWATEGGFLEVEEITGGEVLEELASWPLGQREAEIILRRHGALPDVASSNETADGDDSDKRNRAET